jgi:hypothetical protein
MIEGLSRRPKEGARYSNIIRSIAFQQYLNIDSRQDEEPFYFACQKSDRQL